MGLVYKQLTRQIISNKIFVTLLFLLTILTSVSFFFVKFSIDGNIDVLNSFPTLTDNQELYKVALHSNTVLANMFYASLTSLTAFVFILFFYGFFRANKKQMGSLKSLGFRDSFLRIFFVLFTAVLSTIGSLLGLVGGYVLSGILIEANTRTYAVTGLIKGVNASNIFLGIVVDTTVFCLVTFFCYFFVSGKEPGVLLAGNQISVRFSKALRIAHCVTTMIPIKNKFPLRIALRKPIAVFMILVGVMAFNVCMILGYSLHISSKEVFDSQTIGHNYTVDAHFSEFHTGLTSTDSLVYLDSSVTILVSRQEVRQTIVGVYNLNELYELKDNKGNHLTAPGEGFIYVNPSLMEIYNVEVGESVTMEIDGTSHQYTVAAIAANAKAASVYVNADELTEILGIPSGAYNGILSMVEAENYEKMTTKKQRIDDLNRNAVSSEVSAVINQVIGGVVGAILIFLALLLNFQDSTRDILILSMMGYRIKSIRKLLLDVYLPIIWFFFALTIIPSIAFARDIQKSLSISTGDYMPFGTNILVVFLVFALLNLIYCLVQCTFSLGIKHVIVKEKSHKYLLT